MLPLMALMPALMLNATVVADVDGTQTDVLASSDADALLDVQARVDHTHSGQTTTFAASVPTAAPTGLGGGLFGGDRGAAVSANQQQQHHAPDDVTPAEVAAAAGAAAAAATAAATSATWLPWMRYLGAVILSPLYSRLNKDDILDNEIRAGLYDVVQTDPGLGLQELCDRVGAGWGTTVYHLQRLEQAGLVRSQKQGHHRRFYSVGDVDRRDQEALGLMRNDTSMRIAEFILDSPGANQSAICDALDISPSLAHKYLKRMEEAELVTREREWRKVHYHPNEKLGTVLKATA